MIKLYHLIIFAFIYFIYQGSFSEESATCAIKYDISTKIIKKDKQVNEENAPLKENIENKIQGNEEVVSNIVPVINDNEIEDLELNLDIDKVDDEEIIDTVLKSKKKVVITEERIEIPYNPDLPVDIPRPANTKGTSLSASNLDKYNGMTLKEVYNSVVPDYSKDDELKKVLDNTNIQGNIYMIDESLGFDNTYKDSNMDFNYLNEGFSSV